MLSSDVNTTHTNVPHNAQASTLKWIIIILGLATSLMGIIYFSKSIEKGENPMSWYAAHAIMYVSFKDGSQDSYPLWENILLVEAASDDEAMAKAAKRAKEDEGDSQGTFTWSGRPAQWCFAGIRKLIVCEDTDLKPGDGTEITYLEMEVSDKDSFLKLINGEPVAVKYN